MNYNKSNNSNYKLKPGEKIFNNTWNPMFMDSDSVCMFMFIVDGVPLYRAESIAIQNDKEIKRMSNEVLEMWKNGTL